MESTSDSQSHSAFLPDEQTDCCNISGEISGANGELLSLLAAITSCCPYAVLVHRHGKILYANSATVRLLGCQDARDVTGRKLEDVCSLNVREHLSSVEASEDGEIVPGRQRMVLTRCDGQRIPVDVESLQVVHCGVTVTRLLIRRADEEVRTMETLRETEAVLRSVMESSADYILSIAPEDGRILYLNRTTAADSSPADYIGKSIYDLVSGESENMLRECIRRVRETRTVQSCEISFQHPEQGLQYYDVWISPVIRDGWIQSLTVNSRDITARILAEQSLRVREQKLRVLVEQLPAILWTTDRDLVIASCRGAGLRALRLRLEQVVGESVGRLLDTEAARRQIVKHHFDALQGRSVDFQTEWKNRCYQVHLEPFRDVEGAIVGVMGLAVDVTRMRRTSEALHRAHEQLELVMASVSDGLWSVRWDPERGYYDPYLSPVMERITGRSSAYFSSSPDRWTEIIHCDDRQRVENWFDKLYQKALVPSEQEPGAEMNEQEYRIVLPDGTVRWVRNSVIARPLANGGMLLHGVVTDITARRGAEQLARQHQEELAHAGRLSTMGELVAGIAHEINQPLYAITNYAAACRNVLLDSDRTRLDRVLQWTEEISMQAERAAYIISRLANFVRKTTTKHKTIRVNDLVDESLNLLAFDLRTQSVHIEKVFVEPVPRVRGNEIELQQVMINLIRNACDAMADAPVSERRLVIRTETADKNVRVHVQDRGHGFGAVSPSEVFEPFFTTKAQGMGLGLAISRSIIEASGGRLWATSNSDCGATFHFELPLFNEAG